MDGTTVASNVAYGTSTSYQSVKSGSRQLQFEPSGTTTSQLQQSVSFASGSDTTIIASNFSSSIAALMLTDDNSAPSSGDFKLRVVNAAPGLGPADVYIVTPATDLNTVSPTLSSLGFDSYQPLSAGSYVLTPVGQKFVAIDTGSLMLSTGQVRTFVGIASKAAFPTQCCMMSTEDGQRHGGFQRKVPGRSGSIDPPPLPTRGSRREDRFRKKARKRFTSNHHRAPRCASGSR